MKALLTLLTLLGYLLAAMLWGVVCLAGLVGFILIGLLGGIVYSIDWLLRCM